MMRMILTEGVVTAATSKLLVQLWRDVLGPNAEAKRLLMELRAQADDAGAWTWLAVGSGDGSVTVLAGRERWVAEETARIMESRSK